MQKHPFKKAKKTRKKARKTCVKSKRHIYNKKQLSCSPKDTKAYIYKKTIVKIKPLKKHKNTCKKIKIQPFKYA